MKALAAKKFGFQDLFTSIVTFLSVIGGFFWKYKRPIILSSLVVGLVWLVASSWFGFIYAVPHTSMFLLGASASFVYWLVIDVRISDAKAGWKKASNNQKWANYYGQKLSSIFLQDCFLRIWFLVFLGLYIVVPFVGRASIVRQGRYWAVEKDGVWIYESPIFLSDGDVNRSTSYPHLSFFQKAKDPFSLPGQKWDSGGFVWEDSTITSTTEVKGFLLTIKTGYRAVANEDQRNILALRAEPLSNKMIKERILKDFVPLVVARTIEVSEQCKLDFETEVVTGFRPTSPLRDDIVFRDEQFTCTYKLKPIVL